MCTSQVHLSLDFKAIKIFGPYLFLRPTVGCLFLGSLTYENVTHRQFWLRLEISSSMGMRWRIWRRRHHSISQSASSSFVLRLPIGRKLFFEKPFYRAGINDSGIKRISKLAIQRDLPLNFVIALNNVYRLPFHDDTIDQENLKNKISDLLTDVEISNECIGTVR